ncbi:MAG: hypothetical protein JNJ57_15545 [Saprospiraceae bacterium]|nr:hypothetical protein [Saprospiraceae bacterium]
MRTVLLVFLLVHCCLCLNAQQQKKPAFTLHGTAALSFGVFSQENYSGNQPGFFWSLNGNPVLGVFGHPAPVSLMISSQQRSVSTPFSQFGVSPTIKWAKFHAGVRSLHFSPFSVAGHTFLGGAVEINPGAFRFAVLGGRFQKAREADTTSVFRLRPQYRRMGYGFKIGVGKTRSYFDLIFFKAKDDSTSLGAVPTIYRNLTPDENAVLGIATRLALGKKVYVQVDGGASLYTRDIRSALRSETNDDPDFNRFASALSGIIPIRNTTSLTFAGEAALRYQSRQFQLALAYRRVEPEYASMGAWFFQTDIQQFTLTPGFKFKKGRVRIQLNAGVQNDNLLKLKPATSQRFISGVNLSLNPTDRFGIDMQANNFQFTQENRYLESDSLRLQQSTLFMNVAPHWSIQKGDNAHSIHGSLTYQVSDDYNPYTRQNLNSNFAFAQITWNRQQSKKGQNTGIGLNARINKNGTAADDQSIGLLANAGKSLLKNKLRVQLNANYNLIFSKSNPPGNSYGGGLGVSFKTTKSTRIYSNGYFLSNQTAQRKYKYLSISGGFEYTF